ncbi:uncharacterized protein RHO17_003299 isoform 2-T2 [Thomomys bottae]
MADRGDEKPERLKREKSPAKIMDPPPTTEKEPTKTVPSQKTLEGEEKSQLETIVEAEGEGAAVRHDSQKQPMEKIEGSSEASLKKNILSELKEMVGGSAQPRPLGAVCEDSPGISGGGPNDDTPDDNMTEEEVMDFYLRGQQVIFQMLKVVENLKIRLLRAEYVLSEATEDLMAYVEGDLESAGNEMQPTKEAKDGAQSFQRSHTEELTSKSQLSGKKEGDSKAEAVAAPAVLEEIKANKKQYERVFQLLEEGRRSEEVNKELLVYALREAIRFKCRNLIEHLERILTKVDTHTLE